MTLPVAQDPGEAFDVVTFDGKPTGVVKTRAEVHRDGDWHRSIHVWVVGTDERGPFITFQRRSRAKDTWGGMLDATVGGHFRSGETLVETLREVEEEIGVSVDQSDLIRLGTRAAVDESDPNIRDHELQSVFLWLDDRPLLDFAPNSAELDALVRFRLDDALEFLSGNVSSLRGISRTPFGAKLQPVLVEHGDFIVQVDRYFYRIAIAAGRAIAGDRHVAI